MKGYLVDSNIPFYISIFQSSEYIFVDHLKIERDDSQIWEYAEKNNLTIITKDADFSDRILLTSPPPRVIHLRTGNMKLKDFQSFMEKNWEQISRLAQRNKLVNVYKYKIEAISD